MANQFLERENEMLRKMRETARFQAMQSLGAIARMFRNPPARGVMPRSDHLGVAVSTFGAIAK